VVVLAEHLERAVLELGGLRLFGCDRIRGVSGLPRQVLFARGITERAPDRHRPLAWPLDSAVGVEAGFASHFPRTLLVWIGSAHSLALGYCRLATQPCACFVKLKESFIVKNQLSRNRQQRSSSQFRNFWASCRAETRSIFDFGEGRRLFG